MMISLQCILLWEFHFLQNVIFEIFEIWQKRKQELCSFSFRFKSGCTSLSGKTFDQEVENVLLNFEKVWNSFFLYVNVTDWNIWMLTTLNFCGWLFIHCFCGLCVKATTLKHSDCVWLRSRSYWFKVRNTETNSQQWKIQTFLSCILTGIDVT